MSIITKDIRLIAQDYCILLDNGHGTREYTSGKQSPPDESGKIPIYEGEWARHMVFNRFIRPLTYAGFDCYQIVPEKEDISLDARTNRINDIISKTKKQCISISTHINAAPGSEWSKACGWTSHVSEVPQRGPNGAENWAKSKVLAGNMYKFATELGMKGDRVCVSSGGYIEQALSMCYYPLCPAILNENLFMTNMSNVRTLKSLSGQRNIVEIYLGGLLKYIGFNYTLRKDVVDRGKLYVDSNKIDHILLGLKSIDDIDKTVVYILQGFKLPTLKRNRVSSGNGSYFWPRLNDGEYMALSALKTAADAYAKSMFPNQ